MLSILGFWGLFPLLFLCSCMWKNIYELHEYIESVLKKWACTLGSMGSCQTSHLLMSKHGMVDTSKPWLLCSCAYSLLERHPRPILFSVNSHLSLPSLGYSGEKKNPFLAGQFIQKWIHLSLLHKCFTSLHPNPVTSPSSTPSSIPTGKIYYYKYISTDEVRFYVQKEKAILIQ